MKYFRLFLCLLLMLSSLCAAAQLDRVVFKVKGGIQEGLLRTTMENSASQLLSAFNETIISGKNRVKIPSDEYSFMTKDGIRILQELWSTSAMICPVSTVSENCIQLPSGGYQVRNIPVTLLAADESDEEQELVLNFDASGHIDNIMIALEEHRYLDVIGHNISVVDFHRRQSIVDFVENFRTAYNRKDLDYIEKVFSDNALIITGKVVKVKDQDASLLYKTLSNQQIIYQKQTKGEYIARLKACFKKNKFINVRFEELEVMRHPKRDNLYGVTLKQYWNADTYSDVGYLFLMIDFQDETNPSIQVRTWQPDKYANGQPINREEIFTVNDFNI